MQKETYDFKKPTNRSNPIQPIACGVSFLHSQISIDNLVLQVSFTGFRRKETWEIEIGDCD